MKAVHAKFKAFLVLHGYSQKQIAEECDISQFDLNRHINKGQHLTPENEKAIMQFFKNRHPDFKLSDIYDAPILQGGNIYDRS